MTPALFRALRKSSSRLGQLLARQIGFLL